MPHYDYHCQNCQHQMYDVSQRISDFPLTVCPECQQSTLRRGPGGGLGLIFKGSGFYATDYNAPRSTEKASPSQDSCCPCGKNKSCSS